MRNFRDFRPSAFNQGAGLHRTALVSFIGAGLAITSLLLPLAAQIPAAAQAQPPNRFYGNVSINGQDQPEGTVVEAYIGNTLCGSGTVQNRNGATIYLVDVLGSGQKPNCAKDGDTVTFKVSGLDAKETGSYDTAAATHLDLSATGNARNVAQPTVLAPGTGGTPAPPPLPTSPVGTSTPPPLPPGLTETPDQGSATPEASPTESATPEASATATQTATATATATNNAPKRSASSGARPAIIVVVVLALLAIAAGAAAFIYQRRPRP